MTEKEYRSSDGISRSELWRIRESPEKFKYYQEHLEAPTPALIFGQAFHKLALQPDKFCEEFAVAPDVDRRTKEGKETWKAFCEYVEGKTVITGEQMQTAADMVETLYRVPMVCKLLNGKRETPFYWNDDLTGELCKCRTDCIVTVGGNEIIVDIKSTSDASTESFMRDAVKYGYDFQAAMYSEGFKRVTGKKPLFVFIAIEKTPPYSVNILQADDVFLQRGYDIFRELIGVYHDCKSTGNWYGYLGKFDVINKLNLPAWLAKEL